MDRTKRTVAVSIIASIFISLACIPASLAEVIEDTNPKAVQSLMLPVRQWQDTQIATKAIVIAVHGATLHSGSFSPLANRLASEGFVVYSLDMRGFGRWLAGDFKDKPESKMNYKQSQDDIEKLLVALHEANPNLPIYIMGESLGANLAIAIANTSSQKYAQLIDGLVLSSPCITPYLHITPKAIFDVARGITNPFKEVSLEPYIGRYLSEDQRVIDDYLKDPLVRKGMTIVEALASLKTNSKSLKNLKRFPRNLPVLIIAGSEDKIYKANAIPKFMTKLGSDKKTFCLLNGNGHLLLESAYTPAPALQAMDTFLSESVAYRGQLAQENTASGSSIIPSSESNLDPAP
jgi:acylglycerol lipase